jgi:plastocyanin
MVAAAATLTLGGLGLVACGDDSASSSEPAALTVTASEPSDGKYAFDVPEEVEGGTVQLTFKNSGAEPHEFAIVKVTDGTTPDQLLDTLFAEEGAPIPDFLIGAPGGAGGTAPGASAASTISLDEGTYVYFCTFTKDDQSPPHFQNGMLGEFTVKDVASTAALPETNATINPSEYKFDATGLRAGENTITFANKGQEFHHLIAVPLADGATIEDVNAFLQSEDGGGGAPPPVDFEQEQDLAVTGPGEAQVVTMTFDAGSYVFLCFITDKAGGPPHAIKGMVTQVDIS